MATSVSRLSPLEVFMAVPVLLRFDFRERTYEVISRKVSPANEGTVARPSDANRKLNRAKAELNITCIVRRTRSIHEERNSIRDRNQRYRLARARESVLEIRAEEDFRRAVTHLCGPRSRFASRRNCVLQIALCFPLDSR